MQRIFAAVKIFPDEGLIELLYQMQQALSKDRIKWVDPSNMHITLKFFGETPEEKVMEIDDALKKIKAPDMFDLQCQELGIFGSQYKPRVIWLGINDTDSLQHLESLVRAAIEPLGYQPDRQNFVPHLTLARINSLSDKKYFQDVINTYRSHAMKTQQISAFHLYESKLGKTGPQYSILGSYSLGKY